MKEGKRKFREEQRITRQTGINLVSKGRRRFDHVSEEGEGKKLRSASETGAQKTLWNSTVSGGKRGETGNYNVNHPGTVRKKAGSSLPREHARGF